MHMCISTPMYRYVVVDSRKRSIKAQVGDSKESDYVGDNVHGNTDVYFLGWFYRGMTTLPCEYRFVAELAGKS